MQLTSTFEENYFSAKDQKNVDQKLNHTKQISIRIAGPICELYFPESQNFTQVSKYTFQSMETMESQDVSPIELIKITPYIPRKHQKILIQHDFNQFIDNLKSIESRSHQQPHENQEIYSKNLTVKTESSKSQRVINKLKKNQITEQDEGEEYSIWDNSLLEDQGYDCQSFLNKEGKELTFYQLYRLRQCQLFGNISQQITIDYVFVISNHYKYPIQRQELSKQKQYLDNNYKSYQQVISTFGKTKSSNNQNTQFDHLDKYKKQHQHSSIQNTQTPEQIKKQIRKQTPQQNSYESFQTQTIPLLAYYTPKQIQHLHSTTSQQTPLKIQQTILKQKSFVSQTQQTPKNILDKKKQFLLKDQQSQQAKSNNSTNSILNISQQHNMSKQQLSYLQAIKENINHHSNQSKSSLRVFNASLSNNFSFSRLSSTERNTPNKKMKATLSQGQQNYLNKLLLSSKSQNKQTNSYFRNSLRMLNKNPLSSKNSSSETNTPRNLIDGALNQLKQQNRLCSSKSSINIKNIQKNSFIDKKILNINQSSTSLFVPSLSLTDKETPKKIIKVVQINLFNKSESSLQQRQLNSQNVLQSVLKQQQYQSKIIENTQNFNKNNTEKYQDKLIQLPKKTSNLLIFKAKNKFADLQQKIQIPLKDNQINVQEDQKLINNTTPFCNISKFNI